MAVEGVEDPVRNGPLPGVLEMLHMDSQTSGMLQIPKQHVARRGVKEPA